MDDEPAPMIRVMNAYKWFGQNVALNDFSMTVPTGRIYALLGPSGCGKTVLLNCIVGLRQLDDGAIKCGISTKRQIGYMPQDIGLSVYFTVRETLTFYGRMYGLKGAAINKKIEDLNELFRLPDFDLQIKQLSGGEHRRVSLAVTFFHDAKLLLLDEPTVGIDPVLSKNIWNFLEKLVTNGTTVVITTHYIEEARGAHRVGMMREGKLLMEDTPGNVMSSQNTDNLEDAFLSLCTKQLANKPDPKIVTLAMRRRKSKKFEDIYVPGTWFDLNRFFAQLVKNYASMKRNSIIIGLLLSLPLFLSILHSEAYGNIPSVSLAVVSQELAPGEEDLACSANEGNLPIENFNCSLQMPFTCVLLRYLRKSMVLTVYSSKEEGVNAVLSNKAWALLLVPSNFTTSLSDLVFNGPAYLDEDRLNQALNEAQMDVHLDSSNYIMNQWMRKLITERYQDFLKYLIVSCGLTEDFANSPLRIMDPIYGKRNLPLSQSISPAFVSAWCFYFALMYTSGAIMLENMAGLVERHRVAGMTYWEMVAAHSVVQFGLITFQKATMLAILYGFYQQPLHGNVALLVCLLYAIEALGVAYGVFITEASSDDRFIAISSLVALNTSLLVGGAVWPVEGSHPILHTVVWAFPVSPAVDAYKSIAFKGHGLENWYVVKGFVSCFVWIFIFGVGTAIINRSKQKRLF